MKLPPHNTDAETACLGACLISQEAAAEVTDLLQPADFYDGRNRTIFAAIVKLYANQEPVDMITVTGALTDTGELTKIGGAITIADLANNTPTAANAGYYARIVAEKAKARRILEAAHRIAAKGYGLEADELAALAETELYKALGESRERGGLICAGDILTGGTLTSILNTDPDSLEGVKTPWSDLNAVIPSLTPGDLFVVAARPSMGKTALALQVADYAAHKYGPVAFYSLEMSRDQLIKRLVSSKAKVSGHYIRTGKMLDPERLKVTQAARSYYNQRTPLYIDDTAGIAVPQIRSRAQKLQAKRGLSLVVVDYIGLVTEKGENRQQEIAAISRGLKRLAKELHVPVLALAQLNRAVESRQQKRPQLSDLRESGAIEQDADAVMFIYRDEVYNAKTDKRGIAEIIIAKQRNGPTGTVDLYWQAEYTLFQGLEGGV